MAADRRETAAGGEQARGEQRSIALGLANGESRVALGSDAAHRGYTVVEIGVEISFDALARVIGGLESGTAARPEVHMNVDQPGRQKFAGSVDLIRAGGNRHVRAQARRADPR